MRFVVFMLITLGISEAADACGCRIFRRCRSCVVRQQVVQQVVPVQAQQSYGAVQQQYAQPAAAGASYTFINSYPAGSTQYGYSAASLSGLQGYNPDLAMTLSAQIAGDAVSAFNSAAAAGQASTEALARVASIQATASVLATALGENQPSGPQVSYLRIENTPEGPRIQSLTGEQAQAAINSGGDTGASVQGAASSVIASKCASCHGGNDAENPAGSLTLSSGGHMNSDTFTRVIDILNNNDIPEPMQALIEGLSLEERQAIMTEALALTKVE